MIPRESRRGASVRRLDELVKPGNSLVHVPIDTKAMRRAGSLWAGAKRGGCSTDHPKSLDGDVIVAGQALEYTGSGDRLIVATGDESDLPRCVGEQAQPWEAIAP
jgi:hypothetical protein